MSQVKKALVAALTLLLVVTCATAAGFSSFKILASKAVLETITPADGEVKHVNLQSSYMIEMTYDIGSGNQGRAIVQRRTGDNKNVVLALTPSGGKASATFGWDLWKNRFGEIEQGTDFDVSIAIWGSDPPSSRLVDVAKLTFINGPGSAPLPGKVPLATRITDAIASMSVKPEIAHMFRPEEKMIPAPVSYLCSIVVLAPVVGALVLMARGGMTRAGSRSGALAGLFYGGLTLIVAVEVAFWLGAVNLMQVAPVLAFSELVVFVLGLRLSKKKKQ